MTPASDELKAALMTLGYSREQVVSAMIEFNTDHVYICGTRISREELEDEAVFRRFMFTARAVAEADKPERRIRL